MPAGWRSRTTCGVRASRQTSRLAARPGVYRVRRTVRGTPLVSLVIPTAGKLRTVAGTSVDVLAQAIRSVVAEDRLRQLRARSSCSAAHAAPPPARRCPTARCGRSRARATDRHARAARAVQLLGQHQRRRRGRGRRASGPLQRRPRGHLARMADGDARVLAGTRRRRRRRQAALSGRPAAARRHRARRRRRRRARVPPAPWRVARLRRERDAGEELLGGDRRLPDDAACGLRRGRAVRREAPDRLQRRRLLPAAAAGRLPRRLHAVGAALSPRVGQLRRAPARHGRARRDAPAMGGGDRQRPVLQSEPDARFSGLSHRLRDEHRRMRYSLLDELRCPACLDAAALCHRARSPRRARRDGSRVALASRHWAGHRAERRRGRRRIHD